MTASASQAAYTIGSGRAVFRKHEEDREAMWNLKGFSAVEGSLALCNIYFQDEGDLAWAGFATELSNRHGFRIKPVSFVSISNIH